MSITRFHAAIPNIDMHELRCRIPMTRWPDITEAGLHWDRGPDVRYMMRLMKYWDSSYDWRTHERKLNLFPQFLSSIDETVVHFLHCAGGSAAIPLLITHGWPGSCFEFLRLIDLLQDSRTPAFDIIVPSIPGFGFSKYGAPGAPSPKRVAEIWLVLMQQLGYDRFMVQGGDFGAAISTWIARLAPDRVMGLHLNFTPGSYQPNIAASPLSPQEVAFLSERAEWLDAEGGYGHIQRTRPWTPAFSLSDSPVGLAAWLTEKFYHWSDRRGDDSQPPFTFDDLLTTVSFYWYTNSIRGSMEIYHNITESLALAPGERISPPLGFAAFPKEVWTAPRSWLERGFDVVRYTTMPYGGHFAAMEAPNLLADDIREFAAIVQS